MKVKKVLTVMVERNRFMSYSCKNYQIKIYLMESILRLKEFV